MSNSALRRRPKRAVVQKGIYMNIYTEKSFSTMVNRSIRILKGFNEHDQRTAKIRARIEAQNNDKVRSPHH